MASMLKIRDKLLATLELMDLDFTLYIDASPKKLIIADQNGNIKIQITSKTKSYKQAMSFINERVQHYDNVARNTETSNIQP